MRPVQIAPSVLSADFTRLEQEIRAAEAGKADRLHLDVMDGHFVPNITFGPIIVKAIRKLTDLWLDVHLMITHPAQYVDHFIKSGADSLTIHVEAEGDPLEIIRHIAAQGVAPGISLNPETPMEMLGPFLPFVDSVLVMSVHPGFGGQKFIPESLERIEWLRRRIDQEGLRIQIEVDGGVYRENASAIAHAGADTLVAGSAIFGNGRVAENIRDLREAAMAPRNQTQEGGVGNRD